MTEAQRARKAAAEAEAWVNNITRHSDRNTRYTQAVMVEARQHIHLLARLLHEAAAAGVMEGAPSAGGYPQRWKFPGVPVDPQPPEPPGVKVHCGYCGQDVERTRECRSSDEAGRCDTYQRYVATRQVEDGVAACAGSCCDCGKGCTIGVDLPEGAKR